MQLAQCSMQTEEQFTTTLLVASAGRTHLCTGEDNAFGRVRAAAFASETPDPAVCRRAVSSWSA